MAILASILANAHSTKGKTYAPKDFMPQFGGSAGGSGGGGGGSRQPLTDPAQWRRVASAWGASSKGRPQSK